MTCRWKLHKWGRWTVENVSGTHLKTGVTYTVGVQWRTCQRCGKRKQVEL